MGSRWMQAKVAKIKKDNQQAPHRYSLARQEAYASKAAARDALVQACAGYTGKIKMLAAGNARGIGELQRKKAGARNMTAGVIEMRPLQSSPGMKAAAVWSAATDWRLVRR